MGAIERKKELMVEGTSNQAMAETDQETYRPSGKGEEGR